jgi:vacuolar-type H+-ATPase subunit I/STV1
MLLDDLDHIHLGSYKLYSDRHARLDRRRGAVDAAKALPSAAGQHFPFRDEIVAEKAIQTLKRASRRLYKYQARYERAVAIARRSYGDQVSYLNRQNDRDEEQREKLRTEIAHIQNRLLHNKLMVRRTLRQRLANYQIGNQEARTDGKAPECFRLSLEETTAELALAGTFDWFDGVDGHSSKS